MTTPLEPRLVCLFTRAGAPLRHRHRVELPTLPRRSSVNVPRLYLHPQAALSVCCPGWRGAFFPFVSAFIVSRRKALRSGHTGIPPASKLSVSLAIPPSLRSRPSSGRFGGFLSGPVFPMTCEENSSQKGSTN
jgi:hypothetical protein